MAIPVIDVFAGPGGLNEGFARHGDGGTFSIEASFEMEPNAVETLKLRAAVRLLTRQEGVLYQPYVDALNGNELGALKRADEVLRDDQEFQSALKRAGSHVFLHELGQSTRAESDGIIKEKLSGGGSDWVLIGGPPCQAYSLVGRSRRTGDSRFYDDVKHTLYREYLHIVEEFKPTVFVMENVKGLLSARTARGDEGHSTFALIKQDMEDLGYVVHSLVVAGEDLQPSDYVIRAEDFGVPQRRHRVILLGVRKDAHCGAPKTLTPARQVSVEEVLRDLPERRSRISRGDSEQAWLLALEDVLAMVPGDLGLSARLPNEKTDYGAVYGHSGLMGWLRPPGLRAVTLHESRSHMRSDLQRYAYLAVMAQMDKRLSVTDLPEGLRPNHKNLAASTVPFIDRFKVQAADRPSSTVTSHISKDGHYYIHYDPLQMRSLTVREAARLQTFPDDYYFVGNRTAQYHQVGNAVPPWLAKQVAAVVAELLGQ